MRGDAMGERGEECALMRGEKPDLAVRGVNPSEPPLMSDALSNDTCQRAQGITGMQVARDHVLSDASEVEDCWHGTR